MDIAVPNQSINKGADWIRISQIQSLWFTATFLFSFFSFPLSSYFSEFIGIQSNILSIVARALTVLNCTAYLFFLLVYRLFRPSPYFYVFLLFWIFYAIRIIHDTTLYPFQLGKTPNEYYLFAFVLCFYCSIPFFNPVRIPWVTLQKWAISILIVLNMLGLYNNLTAENIFLERLGGNERLNPISFGLQAALLIIISLIQIIKGKIPFWKYLAFVFFVLVGMINMVVAASKSPIIFLFFSFLLIVIYSFKIKNNRAIIIISSIFVGLTYLVFSLGLEDIFLLAINRLTDIDQDQSSYERMSLLMGGLNQFLEKPLFGSFLEEIIFKEYPHNLVLEAFMAIGIIGGVIFIVFYASCWIVTLNNIFRSKLSAPCFICLAILVLSIFSGGLSFASDFWMASATMFGLNRQFKYNL